MANKKTYLTLEQKKKKRERLLVNQARKELKNKNK
jgi:hypothetical protein